MAIGSVYELVDYKKETIKLAKKYGGGGGELEPRVQELELEVGQLSASVLTITGDIEALEKEKIDLTAIADAYNPEKTTQTAYPKGDYVTYNEKLWKANDAIKTKAGAFNTEMWDAIDNYDPEETYSQGNLVVYSGAVYRCISTEPVTGEWDSTKWYEDTYVSSYDVTYNYYSVGSVVEYAGAFYKANSNYHNAPLGDFDRLLWTETTVEGVIADSIPKQTTVNLFGLSTDEDGMISNSDFLSKAPNGVLTGRKILEVFAFPYSGMAPYGKTGFFLTRVNPNYWLLEAYVSGERVAVKSEAELGGQYCFTVIYV